MTSYEVFDARQAQILIVKVYDLKHELKERWRQIHFELVAHQLGFELHSRLLDWHVGHLSFEDQICLVLKGRAAYSVLSVALKLDFLALPIDKIRWFWSSD